MARPVKIDPQICLGINIAIDLGFNGCDDLSFDSFPVGVGHFFLYSLSDGNSGTVETLLAAHMGTRGP